jgi:hypothetical protein
MTLMSRLPHQPLPVVPQVLVVEPMLVALVQVRELQLEQDRFVEVVEVVSLQVEEGYRGEEDCLGVAVLPVPLQPFQAVVEVALIL